MTDQHEERADTTPAPPGNTPEAADDGLAVPRTRIRRPYLDNLKVVLVAGVILGHVCITYGDIGSWAYHEPSDNEVFNLVTAAIVAVGALFAMGLFFLIAGLLTPGPLARKGTSGFLRDRMIRLGVPFLAYLLVVYPLMAWLGTRAEEPERTVLDHLADLDPGPLWFVGVLLLFSAGYAAWRGWRPAVPATTSPSPAPPLAGPAPSGRLSGPLRPRHLVALAAAIALGSFLVRLEFPIDSWQLFAAHVWQWPQCLGLFVLGILAAERGWLQPVPDNIRRLGGWSALVGTLVVVVVMATAADADPFSGGLTWQAAVTAGCEGVIAVGLAVWLLAFFQQHVDHAGPLAAGLGRAAYGAYLVQAPVLVSIALLVSHLSAEPQVKFLFVAPAAIVGSFALSWSLTRLPGFRRVL